MRMPSDDVAEACRASLRGGSKSFHAASLLLPRRVREPATALYAFCRLADDAIDRAASGADRGAALRELHGRLDRIFAGCPGPVPADMALSDVVARFSVPRSLLEALLEGFAWDAEGRTYETPEDLHAYAARVAGTVGAMMAMIMGARAPDAVARACDLGIAMQFTNIARDVGEDARAGRIYLPLRWLREAGIEPHRFLAQPEPDPRLAGVVRRLLAAADGLYARADRGIARLPPACRPGIRAARLLYAEIGREVERRGGDSITGRAQVPAARKIACLARALVPGGRSAAAEPPLAGARFLVEAVALAPLVDHAPVALAGVRGRLIWLLDLFERLERRAEWDPGASQA